MIEIKKNDNIVLSLLYSYHDEQIFDYNLKRVLLAVLLIWIDLIACYGLPMATASIIVNTGFALYYFLALLCRDFIHFAFGNLPARYHWKRNFVSIIINDYENSIDSRNFISFSFE